MGEDGPSDLINGRYALQEVLGEGAYGVVWRALDTRDGGRAVALKLLKADVASGPEGLLRFHNEALALAALEHPNVVRLLDRGSWQGRRYLVLELVPGSTLRARLDRGEAPTLDQARSLHEQVCAGVAAAHAVRDPGAIVHRDLKPANILLGHSDDGALVVKVTDFGLARLGERQYTHTGAHIGTPDYMAPEQATGQVDRIGPWTDVFALGVLLVELLTGRRTAGGTEPWWALSLRAEGSVRGRLGSMRVDVPSSVWDVVAGALRQDPRARPADAEALRTALQAAWVGQAPPELVPAKLPRAPRRRALLVTLAGLAAVSVVLSAVFVRGRLGRSTARAAVPTGTRGPCPEGMLWVRGGRFLMGSPGGAGPTIEHPQRVVSLRPYCMDRTEVTVASFLEVRSRAGLGPVAATPNWTRIREERRASFSRWCNVDKPDRERHPINCVDWQQAADHCRGRGARLPTEAEWEYAARGADGRRYPWGDSPPTPERLNGCGRRCREAFRAVGLGWTALYDGDDGWASTATVGSFPQGASAFGLLDMAGNVWEWTADWLGPYARSADVVSAPTGPATGTERVNRGGGWDSGDPSWLRTAERNGFLPTYRGVSLGMRCARDL